MIKIAYCCFISITRKKTNRISQIEMRKLYTAASVSLVIPSSDTLSGTETVVCNFYFTMFLLTRFFVCLSEWNFVSHFKQTSQWARDLKFGSKLRSR